MIYYVIVDEVDITQAMINKSIGSDYTKLRRNVGKGPLTNWRRIFTIMTPVPDEFINYVICQKHEIKVILATSDWLDDE